MTKYAKLDINNVVEQIQPYFETGFESCPDNVAPGYVKNGANWDAPIIPTASLETKERAWRNAELFATDFTQLDDAPLTAQQAVDYLNYRQKLRDMPTLAGFPTTHTRPTKPV